MIYNVSTNTVTLNLNNTTDNKLIFKVTGSIVFSMWGEITTAISANHTAASWQIMNSGTTRTTLTNATNTLSSLGSGSVLRCLATSGAMQISNIGTQSVLDPGASNVREMVKWVCIPQNTDTFYYILHRYTTTDAPSSGAVTYSLLWYPLDTTATVVAQ